MGRGRPKEGIQRIAFEIATLGRSGLDVNNAEKRYCLNSLPGEFTALHLVCLMYVGFQIVAPGTDVGFDLANPYSEALERA